MSASSYVCRKLPTLFSMLLLLLAVGACTEVRFISDYDEATDRQVTRLQRDVETFFVAMERNPVQPACSHASNDAFYAQATTDINLLIARNQIRIKNDLTNRQLALLKSSIGDLEALHELADEEGRCLGPNEFQALRVAFGASFGAILKLELAKRRGETEGGAN